MLPDGLESRIDEMRRHLACLGPSMASIKIRMELQGLAVLIVRTNSSNRSRSLLRLACIEYLNAPPSEHSRWQRSIGTLLDRLQRNLIDARPSEAAIRLGKDW